jgi:hypothetical protein
MDCHPRRSPAERIRIRKYAAQIHSELSASRLDFYHKQIKKTRRMLTLRLTRRASH